MTKLNKLQINILRTLFKSYGELDSYTLFKRMKVSISELSNALDFLTKHEMVTEEDHNIKLTLKGKGSIYIDSTSSYDGNKKWREVPDEFKLNDLGVNEPYLPSVRLLDKKTFKINDNEVS